jgi:D-alanine-D-alanine ligase
MDKIASKLFLQSSGIRVVEGEWFYAHHWLSYQSAIVDDLEKKLKYPMIVKPADIGSSVGVKPAKNRNELVEAIDFARHFSPRILIERMLVGMREINISVLGDSEKLELSVCEEPITTSEFLTYEDKYVNEGQSKGMSSSKRQIPANISTDIKREIERMAAEAFIALDCAGVTRIDFMIEKETQLPYINEFNTVPGSLSFYLWEASGKTFKQMLQAMIDAAFRGYRRKEGLTRSNDINILTKADLKGLKK